MTKGQTGRTGSSDLEPNSSTDVKSLLASERERRGMQLLLLRQKKRGERHHADSASHLWYSVWGAFLLGLLVYLPSLSLGFIHDDHSQIENNHQIQSWKYVGKLLTTHVWSQRAGDPGHFYRPLFSLWMLVVYSIGGLSPWVWHLSSVLLNALAIWIVFTFCLPLLSTKPSPSPTLLFAVQPIHVDSLSSISASDELLFTIFALLSVVFSITSSDAPNSARRFHILSVLSYSASLFTKETAIAILPIVLLIILFWNYDQPRGVAAFVGPTRRIFASRGLAPFFYICARWTALRGLGVETGRHSWRQVFFTGPSVLLFYGRELIWPKHPVFFYL